MGDLSFSIDDYTKARSDRNISSSKNVTRVAEEKVRKTGHLDSIVDPAINPIRQSKIRLDEYGDNWISTCGCPMDIELLCDTTGSMGSEVDTLMETLPDLYGSLVPVLNGYDPQVSIGIFGDHTDPFVLCRPQFEMHAEKIVDYLSREAPQRRGGGNSHEDPQYGFIASAYLTDRYTNKIGLKGYHFTVTDEPVNPEIDEYQIRRIFGENILKNELAEVRDRCTDLHSVIQDMQSKVHQFVFLLPDYFHWYSIDKWSDFVPRDKIIRIRTTADLPKVIAAVIGLVEGTLDFENVREFLGPEIADMKLLADLSVIDIGAQAELKRKLPSPVPKKGDIFAKKTDIWPIPSEADKNNAEEEAEEAEEL